MTPEHLGIGMTSQRTRERLVQRLRDEGIHDRQVLDQMRNTPRHLFVDEALASRAYEEPALPIGNGQTISQPYIVARMTEALLEGGPLESVLEVGTGSGYQTAVLAPLVRRVYTVERIKVLLDQARRRFQSINIRNIVTKHTDGGLGLPEYAPFDGIIVTAAAPNIPPPLLEQLKPGAPLVIPVGEHLGYQELLLVTVDEKGEVNRRTVLPVRFVPLTGDR